MDIYYPVADTALLRPLVILAHGGSFMHGDRKSDRLPELCVDLAKRGYVAVSIEYRLTHLIGMSNKAAAYRNILNSVADGRACIQWFLNDAAKGNAWHIDTTKIFVGGVSAGAILSEQLGFLDKRVEGNNALFRAVKRYLPDSTFHAAKLVRGIISLAGAVLDTSIINHNAPGILHIHGDEDRVVPYGYKRALYGVAPFKLAGLGACRSIYIRNKLPFYEYVFKGEGHTTWFDRDKDFMLMESQIVGFLSKEIR